MSNHKNYKIAIYPGTFEIFHNGHISVVQKGLQLFEKIYIVVSNNNTKKSTDINSRYNNVLNNDFVKNNNKIEVIKNEGYTTDILNMLNCYYIIRGVRNSVDLEYEIALYDSYKQMSNDFEIVYFLSDKKIRNLSSSNILKEKKEHEK